MRVNVTEIIVMRCTRNGARHGGAEIVLNDETLKQAAKFQYLGGY